MNKINFPKKINTSDLNSFFKRLNFEKIISESNSPNQKINQLEMNRQFKPELMDLYRLYQFVILNKRTTILEFGSGWSTIIFAKALNELKQKFSKYRKFLRRNNFCELFVLENEKKFLNLTKKNLNYFKKSTELCKVHFHFTDLHMTTFNGLISTEYKKLPICNPDFIYLDGPGQFSAKGNINGINTNHYDLVPMACDILKIEFFLIPGTIILVDGRSANAEFLKYNLKRKWSYVYHSEFDQHVFHLKEKSWGYVNDRLLNYYKKKQ